MSQPSQLGRADLHMHTQASDGLPTVRELLNYVEKRNQKLPQQALDVIAITDHDRVDASLWAYEHRHEYAFDIIPGVEVSSAMGHVLGLWVTRPIPRNLSLGETTAAIHEQGGIAVLAHPYHVHMGQVGRNALRYTRRPEVLLEAKLDALEVFNAGIVIPGSNTLTRFLARYLGMAVTGSSDAHTLGGIGCGQTRFPGRTADELRYALAQGQTIAEGRSWPLIDYWNYSIGSTHNTSNEFLVERLPSNHLTRP